MKRFLMVVAATLVPACYSLEDPTALVPEPPSLPAPIAAVVAPRMPTISSSIHNLECAPNGRATCAGGIEYRCENPFEGAPETVDGSALQGCTLTGTDDAITQHRMCCAPACVRLAGGDKNCGGRRWFVCPVGGDLGVDDRSALGPPSDHCEFFGRVSDDATYCCD